MKPRSLLSIFFGVFAAVGLLSAAAIGVAAWVLDRSFTAMIENMTADTGWLFGDAEAWQGEPDADQERELRRAARDAEEEVEEEMEAEEEER